MKKLLIVDNSISVTGAFKCALTEAKVLYPAFQFIFIVPEGSSVIELLAAERFTCYTLPMLEIGRAPHKLFMYGPRLLSNTFRLRKIVEKEGVDILQVNDFYNLLGVGVKWLGFRGKLITYVRFLPNALPKPLRTLWITLSQKYADAVVAVSDAVLQQLPPRGNTFRVYDALHLKETLPVQHPLTAKKTTFLYLANYIRGKGQEHALKAFAEVVKINKEVMLRYVGSDMGLEKNRQFKRELQNWVDEQQLNDFVVFDSFETEIEKTIKNADVLLNFSEAESFSMTCAEASYFGVPVIATRCGGPEEIILHGKTGLLVERQNIEEMKEAMLLLADSPELRKEFGLAARTFVKSQFNQEQFILAFTDLLKRIEAI